MDRGRRKSPFKIVANALGTVKRKFTGSRGGDGTEFRDGTLTVGGSRFEMVTHATQQGVGTGSSEDVRPGTPRTTPFLFQEPPQGTNERPEARRGDAQASGSSKTLIKSVTKSFEKLRPSQSGESLRRRFKAFNQSVPALPNAGRVNQEMTDRFGVKQGKELRLEVGVTAEMARAVTQGFEELNKINPNLPQITPTRIMPWDQKSHDGTVVHVQSGQRDLYAVHTGKGVVQVLQADQAQHVHPSFRSVTSPSQTVNREVVAPARAGARSADAQNLSR